MSELLVSKGSFCLPQSNTLCINEDLQAVPFPRDKSHFPIWLFEGNPLLVFQLQQQFSICSQNRLLESTRWSPFRIPVIVSHKPSITHSIKSWKTCHRGLFPRKFCIKIWLHHDQRIRKKDSNCSLEKHTYPCWGESQG